MATRCSSVSTRIVGRPSVRVRRAADHALVDLPIGIPNAGEDVGVGPVGRERPLAGVRADGGECVGVGQVVLDGPAAGSEQPAGPVVVVGHVHPEHGGHVPGGSLGQVAGVTNSITTANALVTLVCVRRLRGGGSWCLLRLRSRLPPELALTALANASTAASSTSGSTVTGSAAGSSHAINSPDVWVLGGTTVWHPVDRSSTSIPWLRLLNLRVAAGPVSR